MRFFNLFIVIGVLCIATIYPQHVQAQESRDDERYRAYLLEIIELLQQQIIELTAAQAVTKQAPVPPFTSFLLDDEDDVVEWYVQQNGTFSIMNSTHREFINRFLKLTPDAFDDYVREAVIFDGRHDFDAFVETVEPYQDDTWRFALHSDMFEYQSDSRSITELLVHEFAHIGSYDSIPGVAEPATRRCHDYYEDTGCPPAASYLNAFTQEFWPTRLLDVLADDETLTSEYTKTSLSESFVSDYAATSPAEDFAESFTEFVLTSEPKGNLVKDNKVRSFYVYPELVSWRDEIRNAL